MKKVWFGAFFLTMVSVTSARAQDKKPVREQDTRPVHANIGVGLAVPLSGLSDRFNTGGAFNLGLNFDVSPIYSLQVEYASHSLVGPSRRIPLVPPLPTTTGQTTALIESQHRMQYFNFNGVVRAPGHAMFRPYAVGGGGLYYRTVTLTTPDKGVTIFCDPYWYVCDSTAQQVDRVIGDRSSWSPGIGLGGGVTIALGDQVQFYVESRWHYVWGPKFTTLDGVTGRATGQYIPVTFGFRL
jgi:hypothetical protein